MTAPHGDLSAPRIGYVLGTTDGGTGLHVAMLARGSAAAGLGVSVFGPAGTRPLFGQEAETRRAGAEPIGFETVAIGDRPHPVADTAAVRRLRRLLAASAIDVVHAHGMRAGALAALALRSVARAPLADRQSARTRGDRAQRAAGR